MIKKICASESIQATIDAANEGDTIEVYNGTYHENVFVNKRVILRGIRHPTINAHGNGSGITLEADGVVLEGFTIIKADGYLDAGIKVTSNNNTLKKNTVSESTSGIYLDSSSNNVLSDNMILNTFYGIWLSSSSNNTLKKNNSSDNSNFGIFLDSSSNNKLSNNTVLNNSYGIDLDKSSDNTIIENTLSGNCGNDITLGYLCNNNIITC